MKRLIEKTGYCISETPEMGFQKIVLLSINNPDGSIRWIWNATCVEPLFLKFYSISSTRARFFVLLFKLIFWLNLQRIVFKTTVLYFKESPLSKPSFNLSKNWALFSGTIGPNNKIVVYADGNFHKIATTEKAQKLLKNEVKFLKILNFRKKQFFEVPKYSLIDENTIIISDVSIQGKRCQSITPIHANAILEMDNFSKENKKISEWIYLNELIAQFKTINDDRLPQGLIKKINTFLNQIDINETLDLHFSHGDFTPWNTFLSPNNNLAVYDWELASLDRPKGFDFFHFIIQNGILVEHKSWKAIYKEIKLKNEFTLKLDTENLQKYLKYYLIINILQHLKIYSDQKEWHLQINWMFSVWTDALNSFLDTSFSHRACLILDLFDVLKTENYTTLKFPNHTPEQLSENSDIDIILNKKTTKKIVCFLNNHSLVAKVILERKSFQTQIKIITTDNEILALDCIHKLKWKYIQILDHKKLLNKSYTDEFGVKKTNEKNTLRYIALFYMLNGTSIPEKYTSFTKTVSQFNSKLDAIILSSLGKGKSLAKQNLITYLKKQSYNKGIFFLINLVTYFFDTFSGKGFIITFSGVDGAGKSTIISNISENMGKKFRKPIKILRHRPSVLPILSVYTKGKIQAQEDVLKALPRQGKNQNYLSSLLRFAYYYTDYVLGQFVVYFKYILRGYIVIYDRYYFDFIADCKRSNIVLPKPIASLGYALLMKPKFNFFLYADPEVILKRKKELSYSSISELTSGYRELFNKLRSKSKNCIYQSVKNEDLSATLKQVNDTILLAV